MYIYLFRLIDMGIDGFSTTVFCYGQTGSGKTHTLTGPPYLVSSCSCFIWVCDAFGPLAISRPPYLTFFYLQTLRIAGVLPCGALSLQVSNPLEHIKPIT